jgi:hypothetical protein
MTPMRPPSLATWLLDHLTPGPRNEALAGDLLEEFSTGRPAAWYWRQTLAVFALACSRQLLNNRGVVLFTALWSTFAPAWMLGLAALEHLTHLNQRFSQFDWPWSILSDWGLLLAANLLYIWTGIALYRIPHLWAACNLRLNVLAREILASSPVLYALWGALIVLPKVFLLDSADPFAPPIDSWMHNRHLAALLVRLPFFVTLLCTLWGAAANRTANRPGLAA